MLHKMVDRNPESSRDRWLHRSIYTISILSFVFLFSLLLVSLLSMVCVHCGTPWSCFPEVVLLEIGSANSSSLGNTCVHFFPPSTNKESSSLLLFIFLFLPLLRLICFLSQLRNCWGKKFRKILTLQLSYFPFLKHFFKWRDLNLSLTLSQWHVKFCRLYLRILANNFIIIFYLLKDNWKRHFLIFTF